MNWKLSSLFASLLWLAAAPILLAADKSAETTDRENHDRPNIIFILCDDLGWGDLGVLHQNDSQHSRRHHTPLMDQMAAEGMQLRAHYCPAPVCAPSRASLLSGVHQGNCAVRDNQFDKALSDNHTLGTVLQQAGYRTALIGKYGLQGQGDSAQTWPAYPTRRGFDEFYGYVRHGDGHVHYPADAWPLGNNEGHRSAKQLWHNDMEVSDGLSKCYTTDLFTARSKHWITQHRDQHGDQPFFLYLAYDTPHAALQVPTMAYPQGGGISGGLQWLGEPGQMINTAGGEIDSYRHPDYRDRGWSDVEQRFATMVRRIDDGVGDLLQTLRDLQIDHNTLVVISSDNGPHHESYLAGKEYAPTSFQSYGPFEGVKRDTREGGIRVPTLAWWPGKIPPGSVDRHPSQFHDWMPTFADLAGIAAPARSDGVSLRPTLTQQGDQPAGTVYVEYKQSGSTPKYDDFLPQHRGQKRGQMQVIYVDGYKGIRMNIRSHADPFEIYDLQQDPQEKHNLAGTSAQLDQLQQRMKDRVLQCRVVNSSAPRPYDDVPVPAVDVAADGAGLRYTKHSGDFPYVPQTESLPSDAAGVVSDLTQLPQPDAAAAVDVRGYLNVAEPGRYRFALTTDTKAILRIHQAGLIDADFGYPAAETRQASIQLAAGRHPIRLTYLADPQKAAKVQLQWAKVDADWQTIPAQQWSHTE